MLLWIFQLWPQHLQLEVSLGDEASRAAYMVIFVFVFIEIKKYSESMVNVCKYACS